MNFGCQRTFLAFSGAEISTKSAKMHIFAFVNWKHLKYGILVKVSETPGAGSTHF